MPEKILRAIANPPTLFWAPQLLAMVNMGMHAIFMIFGWGFFRVSPLPFIVSLIVFHLILASMAQREPHLATLWQSWGRGTKKTTNLNSGKTKKFIP
jgi:hypothetical protein